MIAKIDVEKCEHVLKSDVFGLFFDMGFWGCFLEVCKDWFLIDLKVKFERFQKGSQKGVFWPPKMPNSEKRVFWLWRFPSIHGQKTRFRPFSTRVSRGTYFRKNTKKMMLNFMIHFNVLYRCCKLWWKCVIFDMSGVKIKFKTSKNYILL